MKHYANMLDVSNNINERLIAMENTTSTPATANTPPAYKTQWRAFFKKGLGTPKVVYGESAEEAEKAALALYRKNTTMVDMLPISKVVDHVEFIG